MNESKELTEHINIKALGLGLLLALIFKLVNGYAAIIVGGLLVGFLLKDTFLNSIVNGIVFGIVYTIAILLIYLIFWEGVFITFSSLFLSVFLGGGCVVVGWFISIFV